MYLDKNRVTPVLKKLSSFENELSNLFSSFNLELRENTGRRNMLLSQAQEVFFADSIASSGFDVSCSGKTGEPDIVINCIGKELECKLTSSENRSWPLQCDYATIVRKGSLDFLYVLSDRDFSKFAVLFFEDLSASDFHLPAPGSRQKSRMNKAKAMEKCTVLHGSVQKKNERHIKKYTSMILEESEKNIQRINELNQRIQSTRSDGRKRKILKMIDNESVRFQKKKEKLSEKIRYWNSTVDHYEISLEPIE